MAFTLNASQSTRHELETVAKSLLGFWQLGEPAESHLPSLDFEIPNSLKIVYGIFLTSWSRFDRPLFSFQDQLYHPRSLWITDGAYDGLDLPQGLVVFCEENQAVWIAMTPITDNLDAPVTIASPGGTPELKHLPSLNRFLCRHMIQESVMQSKTSATSKLAMNDPFWKQQGFSHYSFGDLRTALWQWSDFLISPDSAVIAYSYGESETAYLSSNLELPPDIPLFNESNGGG